MVHYGMDWMYFGIGIPMYPSNISQFRGDPSDPWGKASAQPVTTLHQIAVQRSVAWWGKGIRETGK